MTIESLIAQISQINGWIFLSVFTAPPIMVWLVSLCHPRENGGHPPWNYIYSFFVYLVCIPGMLSCTLTAYSLFFIRQNLLKVNLAVYFLPVICMIVTLVMIRKNAEWDELPGVERIYALMIIMVVSFGIALFIQKMRVFLFFGGAFSTLIMIAVFCFALLKWGSYMLFRSKREPKIRRPSYGGSKKSGDSSMGRSNDAEKELDKLKKKMGIKD